MISASISTEGRPDNFWLRWLIGNVLAFTLSFALMGIVDGMVDALGAHGVTVIGISGHLTALALGAVMVAVVQSWLLRYHVRPPARWGLATWLAYVTAFFAGETLGGLRLGLLVSFTLFGAVGGVLQSRLMRRLGYPAIRWAPVSCLGWAGGGAAATAFLLASSAVAGLAIMKAAPVLVALGIIGGIGGGVGAALTGPMLARALHHRSTVL
jgi:hypothetical protein